MIPCMKESRCFLVIEANIHLLKVDLCWVLFNQYTDKVVL